MRKGKLSNEEKILINTFILDGQFQFISVVDNRASILFATNLAYAALLINNLDLNRPWPGLLVTLNLIAILTSTIFTFLSIRPTHIVLNEPDNLIYWLHTSRKKREDYVKKLTSVYPEKIFGDFANEIYTLSSIVRYKYTNLRRAIDLFSFGIVISVIYGIVVLAI